MTESGASRKRLIRGRSHRFPACTSGSRGFAAWERGRKDPVIRGPRFAARSLAGQRRVLTHREHWRQSDRLPANALLGLRFRVPKAISAPPISVAVIGSGVARPLPSEGFALEILSGDVF